MIKGNGKDRTDDYTGAPVCGDPAPVRGDPVPAVTVTATEAITGTAAGAVTEAAILLKCLAVSRGVKVDAGVYRRFIRKSRLSKNPVACDCFFMNGGTAVQLTDVGFHLNYLSGALSWDNLKLLKYASQLGTPYRIACDGDGVVLLGDASGGDVSNGRGRKDGGSYGSGSSGNGGIGDGRGDAVGGNGGLPKPVTFAPHTSFYERVTASGVPFLGNAVLQGRDWVSFQCLWPCEYAAEGMVCEYCFSGASHESLARRGKPLPEALRAEDFADIVRSAILHDGVSGVQITGGSTFDGVTEHRYVTGYLQALEGVDLAPRPDSARNGETLLYLSPPNDLAIIDEYFSLGADRIAYSVELWDERMAEKITPGKTANGGRRRFLKALSYIAEKYGPGKAFSNFVIGIEPIETLAAGAKHLAERGILPSASVWMPMGRPVSGSMTAPGEDYYRRAIDALAELYVKYNLKPPRAGLNVCIEYDIAKYAYGKEYDG
jgi:hypothetical protein